MKAKSPIECQNRNPRPSHTQQRLKWSGSVASSSRPGDREAPGFESTVMQRPHPFDVLLASIATCASTDVVTILRKQRTPVKALQVVIEAQRAAVTPRRLASAILHFTIAAPGTTQARAARAVELSITKYCSVRSSLIADAPVTWTVELRS